MLNGKSTHDGYFQQSHPLVRANVIGPILRSNLSHYSLKLVRIALLFQVAIYTEISNAKS